jgi:hypothetical protein
LPFDAKVQVIAAVSATLVVMIRMFGIGSPGVTAYFVL